MRVEEQGKDLDPRLTDGCEAPGCRLSAPGHLLTKNSMIKSAAHIWLHPTEFAPGV